MTSSSSSLKPGSGRGLSGLGAAMIVLSALSVVYASWRFYWDYQSNIYFQQGGFIGEPETIGFIFLAIVLVVATAIIVLKGRSRKLSP